MSEKLSGRDAFNYAFENFTDTVYRVAAHNTATTADAEDISQEVFGCKVFPGDPSPDREIMMRIKDGEVYASLLGGRAHSRLRR